MERGSSRLFQRLYHSGCRVCARPLSTLRPVRSGASKPALVRAAAAEADAPRLFGTDDLPLTMASGAEPAMLMRLPWPLRHPAAVGDVP